MQGSRALGYSLLAGAGGIALLMLLWLFVSGAQAGGIVFGLLLLLVLAGPLAGAGWYVLSRQPAEAQDEAAFTNKRRILQADRVVRRELAAELRQLARRPGLPAARLEELAEDLERRSHDESEWYDLVRLDDADSATLQRYDDLVWERVRWLGTAQPIDPAALGSAVRDLERALDQRRDLLLRGRRASTVEASRLLRAGEPAHGADALLRLAVGDAVSHGDEDYVVEGVASYFAEGRTWKLVHLSPTGPEASDRWLYVGPSGLEAALLEALPAAPQPGPSLALDGSSLPLAEHGTATVDVSSTAGSARGVLVACWLYRGEGRLGLIERWPEGSDLAYAGPITQPSELDVWPGRVTGDD